MALFLLVKEPIDLRGILGDALRVSDVEKVTHLEVASESLHSLFPALLHLLTYLFQLLKVERGEGLAIVSLRGRCLAHAWVRLHGSRFWDDLRDRGKFLGVLGYGGRHQLERESASLVG